MSFYDHSKWDWYAESKSLLKRNDDDDDFLIIFIIDELLADWKRSRYLKSEFNHDLISKRRKHESEDFDRNAVITIFSFENEIDFSNNSIDVDGRAASESLKNSLVDADDESVIEIENIDDFDVNQFSTDVHRLCKMMQK